MRFPRLIFAFLSIVPFLSAFEPDEDGIYAVFDTSMGEFTAKLAFDGTPQSAASFIGLAEGTIPQLDAETGEILSTGPFYDGLIFHRVVDEFIIQSGDPDPDDDDVNGPGYSLVDEMHPNLSHQIPYVIALANNFCIQCEANGQFFDIGENTSGSQFYITLPPGGQESSVSLDGHYNIFGVIVDGTDVIDSIAAVDADDDQRPLEDVVLNTVTILREGEEAEAFDVADYELPFFQPTTTKAVGVEQNADQSKLVLDLPDESEDYIASVSQDLEIWNETTGEISDQTLKLPLTDSESLFARLIKFKPPVETEERIPDVKIELVITNNLYGDNWTLQFNDNLDDDEDERGYGTASITDRADAQIYRYALHRLPNGYRLKIFTLESQQSMTFYLRFEEGSNTTGYHFVWIDDYLVGSIGDPFRYPTTGTFTITRP